MNLAPIKILARYRSFRTNRMEIWEAETTDGLWQMERLEEPGTPWSLIHAETGLEVMRLGTLRDCRINVANGDAGKWLKMGLTQRAERRGIELTAFEKQLVRS